MYPLTGFDFTKREHRPRRYPSESAAPVFHPNAPSPLIADARLKAAQDALIHQLDSKDRYVQGRVKALSAVPHRLGGMLIRTQEDRERAKKLLADRQAFFTTQQGLPPPQSYVAPSFMAIEGQLDDLQESLFTEIASGIVNQNTLGHASALRSAILQSGSALSLQKLIDILRNVDGALADVQAVPPIDTKAKATLDAVLQTLRKTREILQQFIRLHQQGVPQRAIDNVVSGLRSEQALDARNRLGQFATLTAARMAAVEASKARTRGSATSSSSNSSSSSSSSSSSGGNDDGIEPGGEEYDEGFDGEEEEEEDGEDYEDGYYEGEEGEHEEDGEEGEYEEEEDLAQPGFIYEEAPFQALDRIAPSLVSPPRAFAFEPPQVLAYNEPAQPFARTQQAARTLRRDLTAQAVPTLAQAAINESAASHYSAPVPSKPRRRRATVYDYLPNWLVGERHLSPAPSIASKPARLQRTVQRRGDPQGDQRSVIAAPALANAPLIPRQAIHRFRTPIQGNNPLALTSAQRRALRLPASAAAASIQNTASPAQDFRPPTPAERAAILQNQAVQLAALQNEEALYVPTAASVKAAKSKKHGKRTAWTRFQEQYAGRNMSREEVARRYRLAQDAATPPGSRG